MTLNGRIILLELKSYLRNVELKLSSPDDKERHRKRLKKKIKEKVQSNIAKDLRTSGKYNMRVVQDKRGRKYDLEKMKFADLVEAIQEDEVLNNKGE
jgi:hypothetical protein